MPSIVPALGLCSTSPNMAAAAYSKTASRRVRCTMSSSPSFDTYFASTPHSAHRHPHLDLWPFCCPFVDPCYFCNTAPFCRIPLSCPSALSAVDGGVERPPCVPHGHKTLMRTRVCADLILGYNQFSGELPSCLGQLEALYDMELHNNYLTGAWNLAGGA